MKALPWWIRGLVSAPLLGLVGSLKVSAGDRRRFRERDGLTDEQINAVEISLRNILYNRVSVLLGNVPAGGAGEGL